MRDVVAGLAALALLILAASLATSLTVYRRRRASIRSSEGALGRTVIVEIPAADDLVLFTEDPEYFHLGERAIDKRTIRAVRLLVNGAAIAAASRSPDSSAIGSSSDFEDRPDGIARDRWDVAIESERETVLVECGAIRERVSQELARKVYDAVKAALDRNYHSTSSA